MTWFLHNMPIVRSIWLILSDTTWRDDNRTRYLRVSELITPYSGVISLLGGDLAPGVVVGWFRASSNCVSVVWRCPVYLPSVLSLFFSLFRLAVMDEVTICFITHNNLIFPWKPNSLPCRARCCPVRDVLCLYTSPPLMSQVYILSLDIHLIKAIIVNNPVTFSDDTIQKSPIVLISF